MTDQGTPEPRDADGSAPAGAPRPAGFDMNAAARDAAAEWEARFQGFGREMEEAATRWSRDPALRGTGDLIARAWGIILVAIGLWFLGDVTLGLSLPPVLWEDLWPAGLIGVGALVILGSIRRRP